SSLLQKMEYMHLNPLKRGYVDDPIHGYGSQMTRSVEDLLSHAGAWEGGWRSCRGCRPCWRGWRSLVSRMSWVSRSKNKSLALWLSFKRVLRFARQYGF